MIFPCLELEDTLQINDKTRFDARKSFASNEGEIALVTITPEEGVAAIDVSDTRFLDWQYATPGVKTVTLTLSLKEEDDGESEAPEPVTFTKTINVVTPQEDGLFSSDADLVACEDSILQFVREGRNSYLDKHRAAQTLILDYLDEQRLWDKDNKRLSKDALIEPSDIKTWSTYLTLSIIFEGISNAVDDIFSVKAAKYKALAEQKKGRAILRLDTNGDGKEDTRRSLDSSFLVRR